MFVSEKDTRLQALSDFLKTRRARLTPDDVGLPVGGRRRTPGLRREEVAQLAGVGVTWYTWLEQGRDISVSEEVLTSIAQALQLDAYETHHLFTLARGSLPVATGTDHVDNVIEISAAMRSLLENQGSYPAFILGRYWEILAWNQATCLLLGDLSELPAEQRNHVWFMFANPMVRQCLVDWENHAQRMIAEFRVHYGRHIDDEHFTTLIERLRAASPEFNRWWEHHDVVGRLNVRKEFEHPALGHLTFEQTTLFASESPDLKLVVKIPVPGTGTLEKLRHALHT